MVTNWYHQKAYRNQRHYETLQFEALLIETSVFDKLLTSICDTNSVQMYLLVNNSLSSNFLLITDGSQKLVPSFIIPEIGMPERKYTGHLLNNDNYL